MSEAPRRTITREMMTRLRAARAARERPTGSGPSRYNRYHEAAAVLSWFEIHPTLHPVGYDVEAETKALEALVRDSICFDERERRLWTLKNDVRKAVLARLGTRDAIRHALTANPSRPGDVLQQTFEACIAGVVKPLAEQTLDELSATLQALDWLPPELRAEQTDLPDEDEVRRRIEIKNLRAPFEALAGTHFRGRKRELAVLRDYVGVLAPSTAAAGIRRGLRSFFNFHEKPPLLIHGAGGMGKSTLLARFILDHTEPQKGQAPLPFVYLDCDRPGLVPGEPLTLLLEAVRQLGIEFPRFRTAAQEWVRHWQSELSPVQEERAQAVRSPRYRGPVLEAFRVFVDDLRLADSPLLLVVDTFEEVQYRGQAYVEELWNFLEELQGLLPRLRTVIAGRAPLSGLKPEELELRSLDQEAAEGFLEAHEIADPVLAAKLARQLRGNPLSLKLAVEVLRTEAAGAAGIRDLDTGTLFSRVDDTLIQGQLYRRILSHITDEDVRKLAHPGLILRKITPDLIESVLAQPCGVDVSRPGRAKELFLELRREVSLVTAGGSEGEVRHRADVRRVMLELLRKDDAKRVKEIQRRAVSYYENHGSGMEARAEEIYHRLALDQNPEVVEKRWMRGVEEHLHGALDELSGRARDFLARKLGIEIAAGPSSKAPLAVWESFARKRAEDLLLLSRPIEALDVLRQRGDRSRGSPLYLLEARVLERLGRPREVRQVARQALGPPETAPAPALLELHLLMAQATEMLGEEVEAEEAVNEFRRLRKRFPEDANLLMVGLTWLRALTRQASEPASATLRELIASFAAQLPDRALAEAPELLRQMVREVGAQVPELAEHLHRLTSSAAPAQQTRSAARRKEAVESGRLLTSTLLPADRNWLREALVRSFSSRTEIDLLVRETLGVGSAVIGSADLPTEVMVQSIIAWAEQRERVGELVAGAIRLRPRSPELREIAQRLNELSYSPGSAVETVLVRGASPFLGRVVLRRFLAGLGTPGAPNVLVVNGPPGSGKSYSLRLMEDVAVTSRLFDLATVVLNDPSNKYTPRTLTRDVALQAGWNPATVPARASGQARQAQDLTHWLIAQARHSSRILLLALDEVEDQPQEIRDFIHVLASVVAREPSGIGLRLALLGYPAKDLETLPPACVAFERLEPLNRHDVEMYFSTLLADRHPSPETIDELVDLTERIKEGEPKMIALNESLREITRSILHRDLTG